MKISPSSALFIGAYPVPASLDRYVSGDLALRLESKGWKIQVTSRKAGKLARVAEILFDSWRARGGYSVACLDVFSGPAFLWAEAAFGMVSWLGKPCILTLHGGGLPDFSKRHPKRVKKLLTRAAAVTCPSAYLRSEMLDFRPDMILMPNGLDLSRYAMRRWPEKPQRLVWLRAFHDIYNPELAVKALAEIRKQHPNVDLTMIGPDKGDGSLQRTIESAKKLGLEGCVTFIGAIPKNEVPLQLSKGDIFINTTNFDNTPVSVLEAMACGLPVVSTSVGGIPYLLTNNQTALLVSPADVEAMTNAVLRLLSEPNLGPLLAGRARSLVEDFDWSAILPRWEKLIGGFTPGGESKVGTSLEV